MTAGVPVLAAMEGGRLEPIGTMPERTEKPATNVEHQRGIADVHNGQVFPLLHAGYRILSFSTGIFDIGGTHTDSDEKTTLLWSHYADMFQGVCLALDSTQFDNGIKQGGFRVDYSPNRAALPPSFYDVYLNLTADKVEFGGVPFVKDPESGVLLMEHNREEKVREELLALLTQKSPAWEYEGEVRMIYDLGLVRASKNYSQPRFACDACRKANKTPDLCENATYRDAIEVSAIAIQAVILGTDISKAHVAEILALLDHPDFAHVRVYWSSLHSDRSVLQYNKDDNETGERYSLFIQEQREEQMAQAKGPIRYGKDRNQYFPAKKTVNYVPKVFDTDDGKQTTE